MRCTSLAYVGNSMEIPVEMARSNPRISGNYPWHEQVKIAIDLCAAAVATLALRLPDWCPLRQSDAQRLEVEQDIRKRYLHASVGPQEAIR